MTELKMFFIITLFQGNPKNILLHLHFFPANYYYDAKCCRENLYMKNKKLTDTFQGFKTFS